MYPKEGQQQKKTKKFQVLILLFDIGCICDNNDIEGLWASTGLHSLQESENGSSGMAL